MAPLKVGDLEVTNGQDGLRVACTVRNSSRRAGSEVLQVYIAPSRPSVSRPPRELKGYAKVMLQPGESRRVELALRPAALAFYDVSQKKWKAEPGAYAVEVGTSSRDIHARTMFTLSQQKLYDGY